MNKTIIISNYIFTFSDDFKYETYLNKDYSGIVFHKDNIKYDVVNNYLLGWRLIISTEYGACKDIPFKPVTFGFLPEEIIVTETK